MSQAHSQHSQSLCLPEELTITPIRGYREWAFIVPEGLFISSWDKGIWPVDGPRIATCRLGGCAEIPCEEMGDHAGMGCGLYAWHRPETFPRVTNEGFLPYIAGRTPKYWGVVETAGKSRVIKHEKGFRASSLRIVAIADTGKEAQRAAFIYGVPCLTKRVIVKEFPPQVPYNTNLIG